MMIIDDSKLETMDQILLFYVIINFYLFRCQSVLALKAPMAPNKQCDQI